MKGYYTASGYKGYIPGMGYVLFCTVNEYVEAYREREKDQALLKDLIELISCN